MAVIRFTDNQHAISVRCEGPNESVIAIAEGLKRQPAASGALATASRFVAACVAAGWRAYASPEAIADASYEV